MTDAGAAPPIACPRCGTVFGCAPAGACWCMDEDFRLPMPDAAAAGCLCPACLRTLAGRRPANAAAP
ncbi:MAG: cysteine-rich CWC family protein [Xanthobacteraceae bacterium]|uniref:cysteine-rich CWC family protein n=1 Tax=Pseudolabrys sp. TaxID=1960880 RepID=UPI003D0E42DE